MLISKSIGTRLKKFAKYITANFDLMFCTKSFINVVKFTTLNQFSEKPAMH